MTYSIGKEFAFSAAHHLPHLGADHPCSRVHGHNYTVSVKVVADGVDERGFVVDYGDLDPLKGWIDNNLDHQDLNDRLDKPTAERLAEWLYQVALEVLTLPGDASLVMSVSETPKTWATYAP
jgi:6-pyruvoyltetrahydropterin/6-carboxytetrahydropterin synthase